jgi:hypothetical protein
MIEALCQAAEHLDKERIFQLIVENTDCDEYIYYLVSMQPRSPGVIEMRSSFQRITNQHLNPGTDGTIMTEKKSLEWLKNKGLSDLKVSKTAERQMITFGKFPLHKRDRVEF